MRIFDGDLTVPVAIGPRAFSLPFYDDGDTTTRAFRQEYYQRLDSWEPPTFMDVQTVGGKQYYLISESPTQPMPGGIAQFVREYWMLPIPRTAPRQISHTFRGIGSDLVYPQVNITSNSVSGGLHTFNLASGPSISVGDRMVIRATQTQFPANIQTDFTVRRTALAGTSGSTIITDPVLATGTNTLYFFTIQKVEDGRAPRTNAVPAFVTFEYYIVGVSPNISNIADIPIFERELIIDATGTETTTYTDTTTPTRTSYLAKVAAGTLIVAEHTKISNRAGIFEASTPFVKAE
jgi:hypothetical protein